MKNCLYGILTALRYQRKILQTSKKNPLTLTHRDKKKVRKMDI